MKTQLTSKLPNVGTTIFTVMSQLASDTGAINLSQGFPSFSPPPALLERITHHLNYGDNQYVVMRLLFLILRMTPTNLPSRLPEE